MNIRQICFIVHVPVWFSAASLEEVVTAMTFFDLLWIILCRSIRGY
jgi:hypothetical protein